MLAGCFASAARADYPLWISGTPSNFNSSAPYNYGSNSVPAGPVTNTLAGATWDTNSVRYTCFGWSFSNNYGFVTNGDSTQAVFEVATNSFLVWRWTNTHYYFAVTSSPGGSVTPPADWYTNGCVLTNQAVATDGYVFIQWTGTGVPTNSYADNPLVVTVLQAQVLQANFTTNSSQFREWSGTGDWFSWTNWSPEGIPGTNDAVLIKTGTVTLAAPVTVDSATVNTGAVLTFANWYTRLSAKTRVRVLGGGTITHQQNSALTTNGSGQWVPNARVWLASPEVMIETNGAINAAARGYLASTAAGAAGRGPGGGWGGGGGGAHGGRGGGGSGAIYDSLTAPEEPGSSGGNWDRTPGNGGGAVRIDAPGGTVTVNGTITADGGSLGVGRCGAGSGGSVYIVCRTFAGTNGVVRARGGSDNFTGDAYSGGGGRIAVIYDPSAQSNEPVPTVTFAAGPIDGAIDGDDGTLYFPDNRFLPPEIIIHSGLWSVSNFNTVSYTNMIISNLTFGFANPGLRLTVSNDLLIAGVAGRFTAASLFLDVGRDLTMSASQLRFTYGTPTGGYLRVGRNAMLTNNAFWQCWAAATNAGWSEYGGLITLSNLALNAGCWIYPYSAGYNGGSMLFCANDVSILAPNCGFYADNCGFYGGPWYSRGYGPGGGDPNGGGGGYGGRGGDRDGNPTNNGRIYGLTNAPIHPGSGGGCWDRTPGNGGGLIRLEITNFFYHNGILTANGGNGGSGSGGGGGGSGGGIFVTCHALYGTSNSILRANGGNCGVGGYGLNGDGGGGRIAVWYGTISPGNRAKLLAGQESEVRRLVVETNCKTFHGLASANGGLTHTNGMPGTIVFLTIPFTGSILWIH